MVRTIATMRTAGTPTPARAETVRPGSGLTMFARYAYPPNLRGFCGPADAAALGEYAASGVIDRGLAALARAFTGPWPYLSLMAAEARTGDPFDATVVEGYWIGNDLTSRVNLAAFGSTIESEFKSRAGSGWGHMAEAIPAGARPHHGFHVFGVYPWVGLLTEAHRGEPLRILDRCRIRWGEVLSTHGDTAVVRSRALSWDGRRLDLAAPTAETVDYAAGSVEFTAPLEPGEWVALHWDWVCDRLSDRRLANLQRFTSHQLDLTNRRLAHPGPQMVMG